MKFCFICGKNTERTIEGYCEDCYNKSFNLMKIPKELVIFQCSKCKKIRQKNSWIDSELENLIKNSIEITGKNVKIEINGNKISATGFLKGSKKAKEEFQEINIKICKIICPECSKRLGGYYEAILQLRGRDISKEILDFIYKSSEKTSYKSEDVKGGINLYIGSKNIANQIAEGLKRRYNLKIEKSFKLYTKKEGRDIYKSTFLIRCD